MKTHVDLNNKKILVTGCPGFIGSNLVMRLLTDKELMTGGTVISLDNMNDYYDPALKEYRLTKVEEAAKDSSVKHVFIKGSIADKALIDSDLAMLYQVEIKNLNKAATRNADRFPEDFRFKLTKEEFDGLRFQAGTSKEEQGGRGGRRYFMIGLSFWMERQCII